jgi:hypothetical protein
MARSLYRVRKILGRKAHGMPLPIGPQASREARAERCGLLAFVFDPHPSQIVFIFDPHPSQLGFAKSQTPRCDTFPLLRLRREGEGIYRKLNIARRNASLELPG